MSVDVEQSLPQIEFLEGSFSTLHLGDGDIIVLKSRHILSIDAAKRIESAMDPIVAFAASHGAVIKVLVVDGELDIGVLRSSTESSCVS